MNITIKPGAATQDARDIESIVTKIEEDMQTLDEAIKKTIPSGIETDWSDDLKQKWTSYYGSDVPEAMSAMKQSAKNLQLAVDEALKYSGQ